MQMSLKKKKYINFTKSGYKETFNASIEKFLYVKTVWKELTNNVTRNLRKIVAKIPFVKDYTDLLSYLTIPRLEIGVLQSSRRLALITNLNLIGR